MAFQCPAWLDQKEPGSRTSFTSCVLGDINSEIGEIRKTVWQPGTGKEYCQSKSELKWGQIQKLKDSMGGNGSYINQ